MTLAKVRAYASAKAKHIFNTGVNYDCYLQLSKYFYSTGHRCEFHQLIYMQLFHANDKKGEVPFYKTFLYKKW